MYAWMCLQWIIFSCCCTIVAHSYKLHMLSGILMLIACVCVEYTRYIGAACTCVLTSNAFSYSSANSAWLGLHSLQCSFSTYIYIWLLKTVLDTNLWQCRLNFVLWIDFSYSLNTAGALKLVIVISEI